METKIKKKFDAVKFAREQKDRIDKELEGKSTKEILDYFKNVRNNSKIKPSNQE